MKNLSKKEIINLLATNNQNEWLFSTADKVRYENVGNKVHLRGLIEFSNICARTCKYCGLRCENREIERYRMFPDDIVFYAQKAAEIGYKTIVLQSGEDNFYTKDVMCEIISRIKTLDVALTLSIGERNFEDYKAFKDCGADRYLLRIETTDKKLYKELHPKMDFDNRIRCLKDLKKLGYEVGSGSLVGLPNQTIESIADDILFFKKINADMIGIGPFIVNPHTPLKNAKNGDFILARKVMAIVRLILPDINIPATTAMETLNPNGRIIALQSGANVVMPNVSMLEYGAKYEIYPRKNSIIEDTKQCRNHIEDKIRAIGRTISNDYGFHK